MSHSYFNKQWADSHWKIEDVLKFLEVPNDKIRPEFDRLAAFQKLASMYIKYIQIFRQLEQCYDQVVHPQKRGVMRKVLDGVIGRILEVKNEMVNLELSEYHFVDDVLSDFKLTPKDLEMPIPKYFTGEHVRALMQREKMLGDILERLGAEAADESTLEKHLQWASRGDPDVIMHYPALFRFTFSTEPVDRVMPRPEAVLLIQSHERTRQARARAAIMRIAYMKRKSIVAAQPVWQPPAIDPDMAAVTIQRSVRGWLSRQNTLEMRQNELVFLGMAHSPSPREGATSPATLAATGEIDRRRIQELHEEEYHNALIHVTDKIRETEGDDMKQLLVDQIRQWFLECRDAIGRFPDYPTVEEGGCLELFKERDPAEIAAELKLLDEQKGKKKKPGKVDEKKKGKEKKKKEKEKKKKKKKKGEDEGWLISPSVFVPEIEEGSFTYKNVWAFRKEHDNFNQQFDLELVKEEKRSQVEEEIRLQVDQLMRQELIKLKLAIDGEKEKKKKKGRGKKVGKKKGPKGKKEKKMKDLTPERTIDSLYEELVTEGILVRHPCVLLSDYAGEYNFVASTLRQANIEPMPSLSDVRRVITEYAILPLGSPAVHEKGPHIKSLMLAGPHGTGKRMLVHAVCTETGSNLFDLTPDNLVGKYPGKAGLKLLLSMIFKVGSALQPSVIFIGNCERMFRKKLAKGDTSDPKRLKKELPKAMKFLKPGDRILLVGSTTTPFDGEMKPMMNSYQKVILIPRPDYASRHVMWREIITRHGGEITNALHVSTLAKVSDGYTAGMIDRVCATVLTNSRKNRLDKNPLTAEEFVNPLSKLVPVFKEEEEAYPAWFVKTPLGKRKELAAIEAAEIAAAKAKEEKKNKKKK